MIGNYIGEQAQGAQAGRQGRCRITLKRNLCTVDIYTLIYTDEEKKGKQSSDV